MIYIIYKIMDDIIYTQYHFFLSLFQLMERLEWMKKELAKKQRKFEVHSLWI